MGEADLGGDPFDRDRSVWGDDPEEMDASAVVEELPTAYPKAERRWHDRPAFVPFKAIGMFIEKSGKRIAITAAGFLLLLIAVIIIPVPGALVDPADDRRAEHLGHRVRVGRATLADRSREGRAGQEHGAPPQ